MDRAGQTVYDATCKRCSVRQVRTQHVEGLSAQDPADGRAGCPSVQLLARARCGPWQLYACSACASGAAAKVMRRNSSAYKASGATGRL